MLSFFSQQFLTHCFQSQVTNKSLSYCFTFLLSVERTWQKQPFAHVCKDNISIKLFASFVVLIKSESSRLSNLQKTPNFVNYSDNEALQRFSWTITSSLSYKAGNYHPFNKVFYFSEYLYLSESFVRPSQTIIFIFCAIWWINNMIVYLVIM